MTDPDTWRAAFVAYVINAIAGPDDIGRPSKYDPGRARDTALDMLRDVDVCEGDPEVVAEAMFAQSVAGDIAP